MEEILILIQILGFLASIGCGICGYILACRAEKRAENAIRQAKLAAERSQELRNRLAYGNCNDRKGQDKEV